MNFENLVTTKETSERLYKAGFRAETCFYYEMISGKIVYLEIPVSIEQGYIPLYLFQTLWERLPLQIKDKKGFVFRKILRENELYYTTHLGCYLEGTRFDDDNPAEAAGQLMEWCIKEGYCKCKK